MFGNSAFGGGSAFGQPQQQQQQPQSIFGQPQQSQQQQPQQSAFGGFGSTPAATPFGATGTGAFGQASQTPAFGSGTTGGFGASSTGSAFGQTGTSAFGGGSSAFGGATQQQQPTTGFGGGFGSTPNTGFGAAANNAAGGGIFGQSRPSAFGGTTATPSAFGAAATPATTGAFGAQPSTAFGASNNTTTTGAFGSAGSAFGQAAGGNQGTALADFAPTQDRDLASGTNNFFQTITAMPQYKNRSVEELRLQDYAQNRKTSGAAAPAVGAFGQPQAAVGGAFGSAAPSTGFGQPAIGGFGQQAGAAAAKPFGQTQGSVGFGNAFGQNTTSAAPAFGAAPATTNAFGATGSTGAFGSGFGAASKPLFGSTQTATTGFGAPAATPAFGQANATPGFGQTNNQQQQTGFTFGQKPATSAPATGFGGFGATAASKPATSFSFTAPTSQPTTGFGFGATTGGFGTAQTSQPANSLFGAKPAGTTATTTTGSLFGNTQPSTTGGFGVGQAATTGFGGGTGLFGAKPATTTTSLFGNNQAGTTTGLGGGFGSFGTQQPQGGIGGSFTLPATGGLTSFGTSNLPMGQQQQPLVATVDKSPYGSNPLFSAVSQTAAAGGKAEGDQGTAGATSAHVKKLTAPHYPISPRIVSKIKLRGFTFASTTSAATPKTTGKRMSSLEGISDDAVLGTGAFSDRQSNKRHVLDQNGKTLEVKSKVTPTMNRARILFDPELEVLTNKQNEQESQGPEEPAPAPAPAASMSASESSTKLGYYSSPTLEALEKMTKEDLKAVDNFIVGRKGYGEVRFSQPVDLSDVDIYGIMGKIVIIGERSCVVYPDDMTKAPEGKGLNVPATVRLENCFKIDRETKKPIKDPEHPRFKAFVQLLRSKTSEHFVDYDTQTGGWTFKVDHF
ncbi:nucleoporin autopeptidase-domain-containing protein [Dichotomocladium elegans]|nr:nucleoporin autopeptidase-domain-containing protein [Dichotomocladium elegans]